VFDIFHVGLTKKDIIGVPVVKFTLIIYEMTAKSVVFETLGNGTSRSLAQWCFVNCDVLVF